LSLQFFLFFPLLFLIIFFKVLFFVRRSLLACV
jgi:hypothetical protein